MSKNCLSCENSRIKDFVYLICDINGLLDLKDVENSVNCKYYEEKNNANCININ